MRAGGRRNTLDRREDGKKGDTGEDLLQVEAWRRTFDPLRGGQQQVVLRQNVSDDVYGTFCVEPGERRQPLTQRQRGAAPPHAPQLRVNRLSSRRVCWLYSQRVVKLPRAVLVHVGGVGQVFVRRGNVDVFPPENRLSDV